MKNFFLVTLHSFLFFGWGCRPETINVPTTYEGQVSIAGTNPNLSQLLIDLKNKETINGDVYIKTYGNSFLEFFKSIKTINGNLEISETQATDLAFLSGLKTINGNITININPNLKSIKGLENLKKAKGFALYGFYPVNVSIDLTPIQNIAVSDIFNLQYLANDSFPFFKNITALSNYLIIGNTNLKDLKCLSNLTTVSKSITISSNNNLLNLEGLNQLTATGQFYIIENQQIETLKGLENLKICTKEVSISGSKLKSISSLNSLNSVESLYLTGIECDNLNGLENLKICPKNLLITGKNLKSISSLSNITSVESFYLSDTQCENLNGLQNLLNCDKIQLYDNQKLDNFCALKPLFVNKSVQFFAFKNLTNPTIPEVINKCL